MTRKQITWQSKAGIVHLNNEWTKNKPFHLNCFVSRKKGTQRIDTSIYQLMNWWMSTKRHFWSEQLKQTKEKQCKAGEKPLIGRTVKSRDSHINGFVQSKPNYMRKHFSFHPTSKDWLILFTLCETPRRRSRRFFSPSICVRLINICMVSRARERESRCNYTVFIYLIYCSFSLSFSVDVIFL